jgi:hypothetical protein
MTDSPRRRTPRAPEGKTARVPAAVTRPTRTGVQGGVAYMLLEGIEAFHIYDFDGRQWAWAMLAGTALFSWLQVLAENYLGAGLLRAVPPKDDPVDVPDGGDGPTPPPVPA